MYCDLWPYVCLVFKSGLYWRAYGTWILGLGKNLITHTINELNIYTL